MKEYTQKIPVGKTELTKEDLRQLIALITDNSSTPTRPACKCIISTQLDNMLISAGTLDDFLHHIDLPRYLKNLSLACTSVPGTTVAEYRLILLLGEEYSHLQISSSDETWTLGKSGQIMRFLKTKRPLFGLPWIKNTRIILSARPAWKDRSPGLTLLLTLLSLLVSIIIGILQLIKK